MHDTDHSTGTIDRTTPARARTDDSDGVGGRIDDTDGNGTDGSGNGSSSVGPGEGEPATRVEIEQRCGDDGDEQA
ncbi:hypothetical protein, partial [Plantibacter sp. CFBP 13570]|uniref:hypothetical protein n=1 Tax=Plantibacter sp. CFBP 13570 TaxID=2775272 RepID=UPI0019309939